MHPHLNAKMPRDPPGAPRGSLGPKQVELNCILLKNFKLFCDFFWGPLWAPVGSWGILTVN